MRCGLARRIGHPMQLPLLQTRGFRSPRSPLVGFSSMAISGYSPARMQPAIGKLRMVAKALAIDFRTPGRARVAISKILTSFAAWSFFLALSVYGFEAHGVVGVGVVALIRYVPGAVAAPIAGILIDRSSRRTFWVASAAAMALVLCGATVAAALGAPTWVVFIFPGLYAIASAGYA